MTADVKGKEKQYSEEQKRAIAIRETNQQVLVQTAGDSILMNPARFDQVQRVANLYASTDLVPKHFQNKPANCFVAIKLADRLGVDEFMLMQNLYVVHGRPGMEAKLVIALVNQRGPFTGPIQWIFEGEGKDRSCTAFATLKSTGKTVNAVVTWKMVEAEGWHKPNGSQTSKWMTMPDLMFQYRSATFLVRLNCPEVMLGLSTVDEAEDIAGEIIQATIVHDPEPANEDVPAFSAPPAPEGPPAQEESPTPAEPPSDPVQTPEASPTPAVATGAAYSLEELTAEAERVGIAKAEFDGWCKSLEISDAKRTHKGKKHTERLTTLNKWIEGWKDAQKEIVSATSATDSDEAPVPTEDEPKKALKETISELYEAIRVRYEKESESDVLGTAQALLAYPDSVGAIDDLTEAQAREAIKKCRATNGQGQLV